MHLRVDRADTASEGRLVPALSGSGYGNNGDNCKNYVEIQCELAETARFELAEGFAPLDGLANRWFQPLTHVSSRAIAGRRIARVWEGINRPVIFRYQEF